MNILNEILQAGNGQIVKQLGRQFGLNSSTAEQAIKNLLPAIAKGMQKQSQTGDLNSIFSKLGQQEVETYIDQPDVFSQPKAQTNGNAILADIFGNKDVSRAVAKQAAQSSKIDYGVLKKMLPIIAGVAFAVLSKKNSASGGGLLGSVAKGAMAGKLGSGLLSSLLSRFTGSKQANKAQNGLESFLDFDGDGSIADDVWNLARKLF
ncbi:MAG: DUF937 domain-containing protein [Arenicella sp.]